MGERRSERSKPSTREALALDPQKLLRIKLIRSAQKNTKHEWGKRAQPQCSRARGSTVRDVHNIRKRKTKNNKATQGRQTDTTMGQRRMHARPVCCRGLLCPHTRLRQKQTRERKENPPRTPTQNKQTTQPGNASKEEKTNTTRRNATKTKRQTSKTEHKQDAGPRVDRKANNSSPNSRIKNQGLAC